MNDFDLMERGPRLRRLLVSLLVSAAVGTLVALACWHVIRPNDPGHTTDGPWKATFFFTGLATVVSFVVTRALLRRRSQ